MAISLSSASQTLTSKEKAEFYNGCAPSCIKNQKNNPSNSIFRDIPFVFDAYCSCYCSRVTMRLTRNQYEQMARASIEGRDVSKLPTLQKLITETTEKCGAALYD